MNRSIRAVLASLACGFTLSACEQPAHQRAAPTPSATLSAPGLTVTAGGGAQRFTSAELLARPDAGDVQIPHDVAYGRAMSFRAVPLRALLAAMPASNDDTVEFRATDGFVAQIPHALFNGAATPWIAIEDPAHPWPNLPGKTASAGPFYLIWEHPERANVSPEQWPYQMASLTAVASPAQRWPAIAVASSASAEARRGQAVFAANCLTCHKLAGAGEGNVGPDLMQPMPATAYFTDAGLRALIRNPHNVRTWPEQQMPAFGADAISDADINSVIAYLHSLAAHPARAGDHAQRH